ncbi:MAG: 5-dehydro-4-deoxy-D-glucuronate isomerase [Chitinophagaceae bacterium]|nr:5-dehydro-4-deoxy-D-glucuronate isomerase [Chitinophagaceae bacterium]
MKILHSVHPDDFRKYDTSAIRKHFLLEDLGQDNKSNFVYTHYDRMVAGIVKPGVQPLALDNHDNLRSDYFLERREMGIINVGGDGEVIVDGNFFLLQKLDCLYLGKGVKKVELTSKLAQQPAVLFVLSAPAHTSFPTTLMNSDSSTKVDLGTSQTANRRTIYKYIHKDGIQSCQLVMGLTILHAGSVWNTMPAHTHDRRMEVYFYFDMASDQRVFHYMGEPTETRHILIGNHEAVVSPPWSIHSGSGTSNYSFIWGMAGENMEFTDMDAVQIKDLR